MSDSVGDGPRTIALVGPYTSGKTTLLESMLFVAGAVTRKGRVPDRNTVGDSSQEARERQMSVEINAASFGFEGRRLNVLDCPGSVEFAQETDNALMGVDLAVVVCEPQIDRVLTLSRLLRFLDDNGIPTVLFANRIDEASVRVAELVEALRPLSSKPFVACQVAIRNPESALPDGYVDLIGGQAYQYRPHAASSKIETPDMIFERRDSARTALLESLADHDDSLLEKLLEDKVPSEAEIIGYLRASLAKAEVVPVVMGSAEMDWGVRRLIDLILKIAPGPAETAARKKIEFADRAPLLQILKTYITQHGGKISLARIWRGRLADGAALSGGERVGGLYSLLGAQQSKLEAAGAGDLVGIGRLDKGVTGTTLTSAEAKPVELPRATILPAVYAFAVRAEKREDEVKVSGAMARLHQEDPSIRLEHNGDTHEHVLWGQGEMHLKVSLDRLKHKYGLSLATARPRVSYKEAIKRPTTQHARHKKQSGGHGQFGDVVVDIKPLPRGTGFEFHNAVVGGSVPRQFIPAVEAGVREFLDHGPLGFPVVDVSVTLTDGKYHAVDSSEMAFKTAGRLAMSEGLPNCGPVLLEPIYQLRISVPNAFTANVQRLVTGRRGQVLGYEPKPGWDGWDEVAAQMPQAEMHDLIIELRSLTLGVGTYAFEFDHLQELTGRLAEEVVSHNRQGHGLAKSA
jgi:elongation factor G